MKNILFFICFSLSFFGFTQEKYVIDVSNQITSKVTPISKGEHEFFISNYNENKKYSIEIILENLEIKKIETFFNSEKSEFTKPPLLFLGKFILETGEQITFKIKAIGEDNEYLYSYKTKARGQWQTTFGFNFIFLSSQDANFSKSNNDDTFTITEGTNNEKIVYVPTLMFTWLSNKKLGGNENWNFGLSGGLGYDFDKSFSVFTGPSFIYNENITFTAGVAFHNQKRLNSNYKAGDIINENLTFEQLHSDFIRVNPFVSLSFRLDKNPFKK